MVLADDLMWSTRIVAAIERAGGRAVPLSGDAELDVVLEAQGLEDEPSHDGAILGGAIVDVAARRFDAVVAIEHIRAAHLPVIAVAQHDDQLTRRRALQAGASRVFSYRKFFEDGTRLVEGWLAAAAPGEGPA